MARPLTASLHTVTAVTRVALYLNKTEQQQTAATAEFITADALTLLGYSDEAADLMAGHVGPVVAACLASVRKAL